MAAALPETANDVMRCNRQVPVRPPETVGGGGGRGRKRAERLRE